MGLPKEIRRRTESLAANSLERSHRADTVEAYRVAVDRIITHMKTRLEEPLDLDQIANIAAISKFHLVRVFDELTGTTPHHFLACLRMQRAKDLLMASESSITDICMEVGYTSLGSFSKTFRSLVGISPQQFREIPRKLDAMQFAKMVWRFLASRRSVSGPKLEGVVEGPGRPRGFTFVGTFTNGVPQGIPYSGTVLLTHGAFRIKRPEVPEFHLLAVLVPFSANLKSIVSTLPVGLVASLRLQTRELDRATKPRLQLRAVRSTDPPIVLALPALPPLLA